MITINVTQEDIEQGEACDGRACPIALALCRTTGERWNVKSLSAVNLETMKSVLLPTEARAFISRYDLTDPPGVQPFSFTLELP